MIDKTREIALKIVYKIDKEDAYSNIELNEQIKQNRKNLTEKDIGLISEIVYGVTTWRLTLDEIIKKYSKIKIKKISPWILNILRMGIYQIIFLDKIPKSAAVNESVNLAKRYGHASSSNFVNAILRKIEKNDYEEFFKIEDDIERISKTTSMPKWIVEELMKSNDEKEVEQICKNSNIKPKVTIRVNTLKINKQELIERLKEKNTECKETAEKLDDFLILEKVKNIESDFYDIILSFGFVLGGLIILAQLFLVFQFIRPFFIKRSRNSLSFITSIGSILWLGIAYTAGHAFFSTQLAPLLGVYWVISNHLYFNHDIQ